MARLNLDCLTLPDVDPVTLIRVAAEAGYHSVSLWVQPPALSDVMLATPAMEAAIRDALAETGVALGNLEVFNLNVAGEIEAYAEVLAFGARLGAKSATAIDFGPSRPDIAQRFATFGHVCAGLGLEAFFEPIAMGATRTLAEGADLIRNAGIDARLVVDFVHLIRTGGSAATLAGIGPDYVGHVQICDGPRRLADDRMGIEATADRLFPGEGEFPLRDLLKVVPPQASLGVEAPSLARQERGLSPLDRAREAHRATMNILGDVK